MTKQQITETKEVDWIEALTGVSPTEASRWLYENIPTDYVLSVDYDYESMHGTVELTREETDEEEAARGLAEAEKVRAWEIREHNRLQTLDNKIIYTRATDIVLSEYLEKHRDNPRIGDLENLFRAMMNLSHLGVEQTQIDLLKDCMRGIENES